jgi:hypothetical protein
MNSKAKKHGLSSLSKTTQNVRLEGEVEVNYVDE